MYSFAAQNPPDRLLPVPDIQIAKYNFRLWIPRWDLHNRLSKYWLLYWNTTAGAVLHFTDHQLEMTPDKLVLIPPFTLVTADTKEPFIHNFVEFSAGSPFDTVKRSELVFSTDEAETVLQSNYTDRSRLALGLYAFIYRLLLKIPAEHLQPSPHQAIDPRIDKVLKLIDSSRPGEYSTHSLAKVLNLSESRFIHLFKEQTSMSPNHYMRLRRLEFARHLLHDPERSISEIAEASGFVDRSHLERFFVREFGMTPSAMRKLFKSPVKHSD